MEDIKNHENLSVEIRNEIQDLIDNHTANTADLKRELEEQSAEIPPETPQYAMSGLINVKLNKNQDIHISGDVAHISDKLKSHGAFYKEYNNIGWMFTCSERAGARRFLCMPDALPKVGQAVRLDLAELGRQHVSCVVVTFIFNNCLYFRIYCEDSV
jgi:hypothetical protein